MKTLSAFFAIVIGLCAEANAQLLLNQGDTVSIHFDGSMLTLSGSAGIAFPVFSNFSFSLNYDPSTLNAGDALVWSAFGIADTLTLENPRNSNVSFPWHGIGGTRMSNTPENFQGDILLTMQSGSLVLNDISVGVGAPTGPRTVNIYSTVIPLPFVPVPEPGVISLICLGGVLLPAARYFSRRR